MKFIAISQGYMGYRIRPGTVFEADEEFEAKWAERYEEPKPEVEVVEEEVVDEEPVAPPDPEPPPDLVPTKPAVARKPARKKRG